MGNIYEHLERLLNKLSLSENESRMVVASFTCPGMTAFQLGKQCGFKKMTTYRTLETLVSKKYLKELIDPKTKDRVIYPISLSDIAKRVDRKCADLKRFSSELDEINILMRYPISNESKTQMSIQKYYADEAKEALWDITYKNWNFVYGLGELESYTNTKESYDLEKKWIDNRVKKGRAGKGIFTTNGEVTQEVHQDDDKHLRESIIRLGLVKGHFFAIFPDINLTCMFKNPEYNKDWEFLTIESEDICNFYTNFIEAQFKTA